MGSAEACVVTGYVRLDLPNRSHEEYERLGGRMLSAVDAPVVMFTNCDRVRYRRHVSLPTVVLNASLDSCWYWQASDGTVLPGGNPNKDTRSFLSVQHQKSAWVADAARWTDAEMLVWIDFGVLHVPGITEDAIRQFVARSANAPRDRISMASIWGPPGHRVAPFKVAWHCAGGVVAVPRRMAEWFHEAVKAEAASVIASGFSTWEVNTWANVWQKNPDRFRHWQCDHNATLLGAGP